MKHNIYTLISIIFFTLFSQNIFAGHGGHITLVNSTPYDWVRYDQGTHAMNHWKTQKKVRSGYSVTFYIEYKSIHDKSNAFVKYKFDNGTDGHAFRLDFVADANGGPVVTIRPYFDIEGVSKSHDHPIGFEEDGTVSFILVGDAKLGFFSNLNSYSKDWMHNSLPLIGNKELNKICITGSHDAGMYEMNTNTTYAHECNTLTQDHGIYKQLEYGARYFDIRPVIDNAKYHTGHYGKPGWTTGWQGADGGSIDDVIKDINKFTKDHKELIILDLSHDLNYDPSPARGFSQSEWDKLYEKLNGINNLYTYNQSKRLKFLTLNDLIKDSSRVIIIVGKSHLPSSSKYYRKGFFHENQFSIYNKYYGDNDWEGMRDDQVIKMKAHATSKYFLMSWTLTQSETEASDCYVTNSSSIKTLAKMANQHMPNNVFANTNKTYYPNILYTDLITTNNAALISMAINYRLSLDIYDLSIPEVVPEHLVSDMGVTIDSKLNDTLGRKEMAFNFGTEGVFIKIADDKINLYKNFKYSKDDKKMSLYSSISIAKASDTYLLFVTECSGQLIIGWKDIHLIELESNGNQNIYPYKISSLNTGDEHADWVTQSYHSKDIENSIKGAYILNENGKINLCLVTNKKIVSYDFYPKSSKIVNPKEIDYSQSFQKEGMDIIKVLPYQNEGKTEIMLLTKKTTFFYNMPIYSKFYTYQYFPNSNSFHKVYGFNGNIKNVSIVEGSISQINLLPENNKHLDIRKRFQALCLEDKKIPHSNNYQCYIHTFGIASEDSLMSHLSTSIPYPAWSLLLMSAMNFDHPIFASRSYNIQKDDTLIQTWFLYPIPNYYLAKISLAAMVFNNNDTKSSARLVAPKTVGSINWTIYPNPTSINGSVNIEYEVLKSKSVILNLYSLQGTLVKSKTIKHEFSGQYRYVINTEGMSKGTYYITISIGRYMEGKMLVVQ